LSPIVHKTDLGKVHDKPDGSIQALSKNRRDDQAQALANLLQFAENLSTGTVGASVEGQGDNADAELRDASLDDTIARHVRSSKPAHFDIHKHGEPVAEIDLIRTAYRAGETIVGVVEMNHPGWRLQVMKVSHLEISLSRCKSCLPWKPGLGYFTYGRNHTRVALASISHAWRSKSTIVKENNRGR
jgi:hypothetical protein